MILLIFEFVLTVLFVSALAGGLYMSGRLLLRLLRLSHVESASVVIACGLTGITGLGWYAYRSGISPYFYMLAAVLVVFLFSIRDIVDYFTRRKPLPKVFYILLIFILAFSVQSFLCFHPMGISVGTMGNTDFYHYSLLAEHLLGNAGYDNVISGTSAAYQHPIDVFGVFFILAVLSKFLAKSALESTPAFTIFCLSMIGLAMFDVAKKMFRFKDSVALLISLLAAAGSFMFYIAYNGFYAQLLCILFYLVAMCQILYISEVYESGPIRTVLFYALPFAGMLLVFQAGFLVFSSCALFFGVVYLLFVFPDKKRYVFMPILGCLVALVLFPEVAAYTAQRTLAVSDAPDGWPLFLLYPAYLLSIPVRAKFPGHPGSLAEYFVALCSVGGLSIAAYSLSKNEKPRLSCGYLASGIFFFLMIYAYLTAYAARGNIYQVWKFASFVILPVSFLFPSFIVSVCQDKFPERKFVGVIMMIGLVCSIVFVVILSPVRMRLEPLNFRIDGLKNARNVLREKGVNNIVLATGSVGETLLAKNIFSSEFKLFPQVRTYSPPADAGLIKELPPDKTVVLAHSVDEPSKYEVLSLSELENKGTYPLFGTGIGRSILFGIQLGKGFSVLENWGVWMDGYNAVMKVAVPKGLSGENIRVVFDAVSFPFGESQTLVLSVKGVRIKKWSIKDKAQLSADIPAALNAGKLLELEFVMPCPVSPMDIDPDSHDARLLSVGFTSFKLVPSEIKHYDVRRHMK